jgi:uncharacterized protein YdgA (DUF945 family)
VSNDGSGDNVTTYDRTMLEEVVKEAMKSPKHVLAYLKLFAEAAIEEGQSEDSVIEDAKEIQKALLEAMVRQGTLLHSPDTISPKKTPKD